MSSYNLRPKFDRIVKHKHEIYVSNPEFKNALDFIEYINKLNEKSERPTNASCVQWDMIKNSQKVDRHDASDKIMEKLNFFFQNIENQEKSVKAEYFINEVVSKDMFLYFYRFFIVNTEEDFYKIARLYRVITNKVTDALNIVDDKKKLSTAIYFITKYN
jgi:hypothetical protein